MAFERFLAGNKVYSNFFQPLCYQSRMFEIRFLCSNGMKEMEKRIVRKEKTCFEAERNKLN